MMKALFFFAVSGGIGFLIDVSVYYLTSLLVSYYIARLISFISAVLFTWWFNRNVTFNDVIKNSNIIIEFFKYLSSMIVGGLLNYITFILSMNTFDMVKLYPIIGIALGSIVGMFINFILSRFIVYKK